jgi:hypothetical protein
LHGRLIAVMRGPGVAPWLGVGSLLSMQGTNRIFRLCLLHIRFLQPFYRGCCLAIKKMNEIIKQNEELIIW